MLSSGARLGGCRRSPYCGWRYCRHYYGYYAPRVYSHYYAPRVYGYYYAPRYRVSGYRYSRFHW